MKKLTPAQYRTMETLLNTDKVFLADNFNGRVDPWSECLRATADQLKELGYIEWVSAPSMYSSRSRYGWYTLTETGKAFGLTLSDRQSSASRQHRIETGRYLKYGDRPEFAPSAPFKVDDIVQRKGRPDTCKYLVGNVVQTVDKTYFYDVVEVCKTHDADNPASIGHVFDKVFLSPDEYEIVSNADDDRSVTEHIRNHGKPFPIGSYVQRATGIIHTTRVWKVQKVSMIDTGWHYEVVDASGEVLEIAPSPGFFREVEITVHEVWEAKR